MDGEITADQADEILRAAAELLRRLRSGGDEPTPEPTGPTESTTPEAPPEPEPDEGDEDEDEKDEKDEKGDKGDEPGEAKGHAKGKRPR
jgi:hypothetical protein